MNGICDSSFGLKPRSPDSRCMLTPRFRTAAFTSSQCQSAGDICEMSGEFDATETSLDLKDRAERLKTAVRAAGGNTEVAQRSGIPISNLTRYLAGSEMKAGTMITLAKACRVSVEWLATGREHASADPSAAIPLDPAGASGSLFATLDKDRLGRAARFALRQFEKHQRDPDDRQLGMVIALIYDVAHVPQGELEEIIDWSMRPAR